MLTGNRSSNTTNLVLAHQISYQYVIFWFNDTVYFLFFLSWFIYFNWGTIYSIVTCQQFCNQQFCNLLLGLQSCTTYSLSGDSKFHVFCPSIIEKASLIPIIALSVQFSSVTQFCPTLRHHVLQHAVPVHHQSLELTQTHVNWVGDAIQPLHPLLSSSVNFNISQHQGLFKWVSSSH